ncbi:hypothetical protein MA16_Dca029135 [Dendrobium catenatum]|uniref:Uncharacterized protein n=1 Tax=Dendrobium catenatum TaxID=906689 RepID=A0A2I0VHR5_9ASPA|nr:hypothetical protein MA16_Dca029135 [Dendrobium catenatum]
MMKPPIQVDLSKVKEPLGKVKPTRKQAKMGFKQPLMFTTGIKPVLPKTNIYKIVKELSQLSPIAELTRKRKKEGVDDLSGGDASPFVH